MRAGSRLPVESACMNVAASFASLPLFLKSPSPDSEQRRIIALDRIQQDR